MDAKPGMAQIHENKYQMPNLDKLLNSVSKIISDAEDSDDVWSTFLNLNYATEAYNCKTIFYGLTYLLTELQKTIDRTLNGLRNMFCCLDDLQIVSVSIAEDHNFLLEAAQKLKDEGFSLKLSTCEFTVK